ncbi:MULTISPECIES: glycosyltransferase family 2 protein [Haloferax]|uniref:Glycosyltransferase n=2 Tax=Haloferax TaxID=2251 RepID=A0A6G1Z0X6_9EURY|nr:MULTISPECIES: glycosyltransferase family 2 protein [Haloferax]KAB1187521.1 glycosyltransferase family 2 protein [Haloferax sp. CBA1149]MRW80173.1 glycosyltransferase [Haloferax marinisediminis]
MNEPVSVILVNYNTSNYTNSCIESLLDSDYKNLEIIVVDNNSDSSDIQQLEEFDKTEFYYLEENIGFAGACNYGAQKSIGEFIFFLNNDTELESDTISLLVEKVRNPEVGAVTPQVRFHHNQSVIDRDVGYFDTLAYGWHPRQQMGADELKSSEEVIESPWISGCAFMTTKDVLKTVGYFDEDFFMYCEDLELSIRIRKRGYRLQVVNDAIVYHKYSASSKDDVEIDRSSFQIKHQSKNRMKIIFKHYPHKHIVAYFPHLVLSNAYWCLVLASDDGISSAATQVKELIKYSLLGVVDRGDHGSNANWIEMMTKNGFRDYLNIALNRSETYNENQF